ncbi:hypothetical protein Hanom_Chr08g00711681 [Helianthus anomalus]
MDPSKSNDKIHKLYNNINKQSNNTFTSSAKFVSFRHEELPMLPTERVNARLSEPSD